VAGSMIGEIGALGGGLVPNAMGLSKQYLGSYVWGFVFFGVLSLVMLGVMRVMQIRWTRTWAEKGGRARTLSQAAPAKYATPPKATRT
jgi:NNP family nitrate/nitrite transporter-like MFS transporter